MMERSAQRLPRVAHIAGVIASDIRYAARSLARTPAFTVASAGIFAFGLAAAALAFAIIRAVLLAPLPYAQPDALYQVTVRTEFDGTPYDRTVVTRPVFDSWSAGATHLVGLAASNEARHESTVYLTGPREPARVRASFVSPAFFTLLGAPAARGRTFTPDDARAGVVVISDGLWKRAFGGDPEIVGSTTGVSGGAATIIGVMPARFMAPPPVTRVDVAESIDLWIPLDDGPAVRDYDRVIARLAGVSRVEDAEAELGRLLVESGEDGEIRLVPLGELFTRDARTGMYVLGLIVTLALVIVCANIGAVQVTRLTGRRAEIAIRSALGASRGRLFVHLLTEGLVVAVLGGVLGLLVAVWGLGMARAIAPASVLRFDQAAIDGVVIAFVGAAAIVCGCAATVWPAAITAAFARVSNINALGRSAMSARGRSREVLVFVQIAVALALCAGTGAVMRGMYRLLSIDAGVDTGDVYVADLHRRRDGAGPVGGDDFHERVRREVAALPGVRRAALASSVPFRPRDYYGPEWRSRIVSPDYFATLGIRLIAGRLIDDRDDAESEPIAVISEALAHARFGSAEVIGETLDDRTIVGVVADVRHESLDQAAEPALYMPLRQRPDPRVSLLVAASLPAASLAASVRDIVRAIDPDQPVGAVATLGQILDRSDAVSRRRFPARVLALLAGFAGLLAALGVYGVTEQAAAQRTPEIGIRMTLGATRQDVLELVLRGGFRVVAAGLAAGAVLSLVFMRALSSVLFEAGPVDPLVLAGAAAMLGGAALAATILPAMRAARIDPAQAMRHD